MRIASGGSVPAPADPVTRAPSRAHWADLRTRALSAALLVPPALLCLWLGAWWWTALLALGALGLAVEWVGLCGTRLASVAGVALPLLVLAATAAATLRQELLGLGVTVAGFALLWGITRRPGLAAGVPYLGLAVVALCWLRGDGGAGRANVLFLLLVVWASDIGAYAAGRLLGGPKLAPRISPSKTWAGAAGGLLAAIMVGAAVALALHGGSLERILPIAAGVGIAAQCGDLLESAVKRHYGVKDSSRLIPGHGGLLDRLDGLLTAAPTAAIIALAVGHGVVLWQ
jgi:phosphatidate cytidylyltransferase